MTTWQKFIQQASETHPEITDKERRFLESVQEDCDVVPYLLFMVFAETRRVNLTMERVVGILQER